MVLWLGEYQALTIAGCINQMSLFGSSLVMVAIIKEMTILDVVVMIISRRIPHLSVFKSCIAAQWPVEIIFMKWSCSEVAGVVR